MPNLATLPLPIPVPPAVPALPDVASAVLKSPAPANKPEDAKPKEQDFSKVLKNAQEEEEPEEEEEPSEKNNASVNAALLVAPVLPQQAPPVAEAAASPSPAVTAPASAVDASAAETPALPDAAPVLPTEASPFEILLSGNEPPVIMPQATAPAINAPVLPQMPPAMPPAMQPEAPALQTQAAPAIPAAMPVADTPAADTVPLPALSPDEQVEVQLHPALAAAVAKLPGNTAVTTPEDAQALAAQLSDLRDTDTDLSPGLKDKLTKIIDALQARAQTPAPVPQAGDNTASLLAQQIEKHLADRNITAIPIATQTADAPPVTIFHAKPATSADAPAIAALKTDAPPEQGADGGNSQNNNPSQQQPGAQATLPQQAAQQAAQAAAANGKFEQLLNNTPRSISDQVVFHLKAASHEGSSRITIQLDPVELGKLNIRLDIGKDGKAGIVITADNPQALDMLSRDAAGLQRALADAGLKADSGSLSFNLRGEQQSGQQSQQQAYRQQGVYAQENDPLEEALNATALRTYAMPVHDGLDIRI